jgi:hypothetical protein
LTIRRKRREEEKRKGRRRRRRVCLRDKRRSKVTGTGVVTPLLSI